jgi:pyruvate/2-oxoacid:ferredoxin oxidoreductase alpha subunit
MAGTVRVAVDQLRAQGLEVGALRLRLFRPFPAREIRNVLGRAGRVAVLDRDHSPGGGGVLAQEIKAALCGQEEAPEVIGFMAGIGGCDVTPETVRTAVERTLSADRTGEEKLWLGLLD